jgi:hypothetical protein
VLLLSPSMRQSSELFRKVTNLLSLLEPKPTLTEDNRLSLTLQSGSRVVSLPSSEATVRGFSGASLIIEDEASRVPDELYRAIRRCWPQAGADVFHSLYLPGILVPGTSDRGIAGRSREVRSRGMEAQGGRLAAAGVLDSLVKQLCARRF